MHRRWAGQANTGMVLRVDLLQLHEAWEASWDAETSFRGVMRPGNPAYGQCYPSVPVVQHFYPEVEIAEGEVWTGAGIERHFWNVVEQDGTTLHIDLTWGQFPLGSSVRGYLIRDRSTFNDSPGTVRRVEILLGRVAKRLDESSPSELVRDSARYARENAHSVTIDVPAV